MSDSFDPYYNWLAIPPEEQPANHYRLLGLRLFEANADVIETSADRQMGHVRRYATGQRAELSQKLLNEISAAKVCLLNPAKRAAYDAALKAKQAAAALPQAQAVPQAQALPMAQALPQARAANPTLRTRDDQAASASQDIPIVAAAGSGATSTALRKKKSTPVVAVVGLLAGAAVLIGVIAIVLNKPEPVAVAPDTEQKPVQPDAGVPDESGEKNPAKSDPDQSEKAEPEKTEPETTGTDVAQATPVASIYTPNKPYNLFTNFELQPNVVAGEGWQFENNVLTMPASDNSRAQSQVPLPDEYMVAMVIERLSGNAGLYLGLPFGDGEISASIDNTYKDPNALAAGIFTSEGSDLNVTREGGQRLLENKPVQVMCVVRHDNVQLSLDKKVVAAWKPDGREMPAGTYWKGRNPRHLVIGGYRSSFKISKLMVLPLEPRKVAGSTGSSESPEALVEGSPIDLLNNLNLQESVVLGKDWKLVDGVLSISQMVGDHPRVQFPLPPIKEYSVLLTINGSGEKPNLHLGLPVSDGRFGVLVDYTFNQPAGEYVTTIYDGARNEMLGEIRSRTPFFGHDKAINVKCTVKQDLVKVEIDGKLVSEWKPDGRKLADTWDIPNSQALCVGMEGSAFKISKLEYQSLRRDLVAVGGKPPGTGSSIADTQIKYGKPVDLLTGLDLKKALVTSETWTLDAGILSIPKGDPGVAARMQFPNDLPPEYSLSLIAERVSGEHHLTIGLPCAETGFIYCAIDLSMEQTGPIPASGFYDSPNNSTLAAAGGKQLLPPGEPIQVDIEVRKKLLSLKMNGRVITTWKPDGRKPEEYRFWSGPEKNKLILGAYETAFKISRLQYKPIETGGAAAGTTSTAGAKIEYGKPVDMLMGLKLGEAVVAGEPWSLENGVLHVPDVRSKVGARMQPDHAMPTEYALSMIVERKSGKEDFMLSLPCSSGNINCAIDDLFAAGDTYTTGFFNGSDEKNPLSAKTGTQFLLQDKPTQVDVVLKNELITLTINGRLIAKWKPDGRPLVEYEFWKCPQENRLMVGGFQSGFKVSRLEFKPIISGSIAANTNDGPDTDKIVGEFGDPILEGDNPDANADETQGNKAIGPRTNRIVEKVDPPGAEEQKKTLATVKQLFPDEYTAAKNSSTKLELGQKLLDTARSTKDDPVALYVLLSEALNYAAEAGNAGTAMPALTMLEESFNLDSISLSVDVFTKLQKGARQNAEHKAILTEIRQPIAAAVEADRYADADKLLKIALASARALKDSATIKEVTASGKMLREAQATYDKVKPARDKLTKEPDDPAANAEWGLYLCLVKNNFAAGLPLLAKGSNAKYQAAAKLDLAQPEDGKGQIAVGDQWYALSDDASPTEQALLRLRAESWYRQGVSDLSGLEKTRVEKRIREIGVIDRKNLPQPVGSGAGVREAAETQVVESGEGIVADRIIIWNQYNNDGDRGTDVVNVILKKGTDIVWRKDGVEVPWQHRVDTYAVVVPKGRVRFDSLTVEIVKYRGTGGGLSEIQVVRGKENLATGAVVSASGSFSGAYGEDRINDGITSSAEQQVGYWLLPSNKTGWIELKWN